MPKKPYTNGGLHETIAAHYRSVSNKMRHWLFGFFDRAVKPLLKKKQVVK
jgi:hypothetical protein